MPAKIVSLHSKDNTIIYPETIVSAVHMPDGRRTLQADIEELENGSCTITFNDDAASRAQKNSKKFWFFAHLFVPLSTE